MEVLKGLGTERMQSNGVNGIFHLRCHRSARAAVAVPEQEPLQDWECEGWSEGEGEGGSGSGGSEGLILEGLAPSLRAPSVRIMQWLLDRVAGEGRWAGHGGAALCAFAPCPAGA